MKTNIKIIKQKKKHYTNWTPQHPSQKGLVLEGNHFLIEQTAITLTQQIRKIT